MSTPKPVSATVMPWLKNNLGARALAPLTSTDARALRAAVQIIDVYAYLCNPSILEAFKIIVSSMQPHTRELAYHAIAHVMDWGHRSELWAAAGLEPIPNLRRCAFER